MGCAGAREKIEDKMKVRAYGNTNGKRERTEKIS